MTKTTSTPEDKDALGGDAGAIHKARKTFKKEYRRHKPNVRLFLRGIVLGWRRSRHTLNPNQALVEIEGVKSPQDAKWYVGKKVAYVYQVHTKINKNVRSVRAIWGVIKQPHGNKGVVRAQFKPNLPSQSFGKLCRIYLFPSKV